jgi:hypothetical protein
MNKKNLKSRRNKPPQYFRENTEGAFSVLEYERIIARILKKPLFLPTK